MIGNLKKCIEAAGNCSGQSHTTYISVDNDADVPMINLGLIHQSMSFSCLVTECTIVRAATSRYAAVILTSVKF